MLFDDDGDHGQESWGGFDEPMNKQCPDYNGQPRGDDGRFGKGKQNRTKKPTAGLYAPIGEETPDKNPPYV